MLPNPKIFNPFKRLKSVQKMQSRVVWLLENAREITPAQAQGALTGFTLRGGIAPQETVTAEEDSLEEARYFEPTPDESIPTISPYPLPIAAADSVAPPDSSVSADSSNVNLPY